MKTIDVLVVGGGPAGCATAITCAKQGFSTTLLEKNPIEKTKLCGGLLPLITRDLLDELEIDLSPKVFANPKELGLFYWPPSGRENSGNVKNYRLLNINRGNFDHLLRDHANQVGVQILQPGELLEFRHEDQYTILVRIPKGVQQYSARYIIGADGATSFVRRSLGLQDPFQMLTVLQETWEAKGDFHPYYYVFYSNTISSTFAYVIPKNQELILGVGSPKRTLPNRSAMNQFKQFLANEFNFAPTTLMTRNSAPIPYGQTLTGKENVILVGDAGGFCNPLSGEGIRYAIETGIEAGSAIKEAERQETITEPIYAQRLTSLRTLLAKTYELALEMNDTTRESFVQSELERITL